MVVGDGALPLAAGAAVGCTAAVLIGHVARNQLFGVAPGDPATLAGTVLLLALVGGLASALPARRATSIDPVVTLRDV